MGYYIQGPIFGKTAFLTKTNKELEEIDLEEATRIHNSPDIAIIVVVENALFEAAGFIFSQEEFEAFTDRSDLRPKKYIKGPRKLLEKLSGYNSQI